MYVFRERQRDSGFSVTAAVASRRGYMAARPFHATFTILFYFERYIFSDFIARLARYTRNTLQVLVNLRIY